MTNRLYRSQTERMLGGVCGGLAKYLQIDLTIIRLFFVVLTLLGGFGPLLYLILWIVVPLEGQVDATPQSLDGEELKERAEMVKDEFVTAVKQPSQNSARFIGIALVLAGAYIFMKELNIPWLSWLDSGVIWAGLILLAGIVLLVRATRKD